MRAIQAAAGAILLLMATPACAHRLDEYLEATLIAVGKERVEAQIRLAPGVKVFPAVLQAIDTDGDRGISKAEERAYAERVLRDLSLSIDGDRLRLRLVSSASASLEELREGRGAIDIDFDAEVPRGGPDRRLTFENHHLSPIAAYLVNGLVPEDPEIRIQAQNRNQDQSFYQMDYVQAGAGSASPPAGGWSHAPSWLGAAVAAVALLLAGRWGFLPWEAWLWDSRRWAVRRWESSPWVGLPPAMSRPAVSPGAGTPSPPRPAPGAPEATPRALRLGEERDILYYLHTGCSLVTRRLWRQPRRRLVHGRQNQDP